MAWILPTYNRPKQCAALMDRIREVGCSTPGMVVVNGTDCEAEYRSMTLPDGWDLTILPENIGICGALNWYFSGHKDDPFYGSLTDDEWVHSPDWDKTLVKAAGGIYISHGNEGWQSENRIHGAMVLGGDLVRAMGYILPEGLWHWYSDDVWELIALEFRIRRWCKDVKLEHRHYRAGKAEKDDTYRKGEYRAAEDRKRFEEWRKAEWPILREKLKPLYTSDAQFDRHGNLL